MGNPTEWLRMSSVAIYVPMSLPFTAKVVLLIFAILVWAYISEKAWLQSMKYYHFHRSSYPLNRKYRNAKIIQNKILICIVRIAMSQFVRDV
jgi:glucose-6-phosphate-specific signal transduction histidine kinase